MPNQTTPVLSLPRASDLHSAQAIQPLRGRMLDLELLRAFTAVVECKGHTEAARYLNRTQAAVSQQLRRLEESTGATLFEVPKRRMKLTRQGFVLLEYARRMIALNHEALSQLRPDEVHGTVRMGATNYYATHVLPRLFVEFSNLYPHIHIDLEVHVADVMQKRLETGLDLAINSYQVGEGRGTLLRRDQVVWVASRRAPPINKDPLPLAVLPPGSLLRRWAEQALTKIGRRWVVVQESSSIDVLRASVLAGLAVGVFQRGTVKSIRDLMPLSAGDGFPRLPSSEMWMQCANRELPPAAKRLHEFLLSKLPPGEAATTHLPKP